MRVRNTSLFCENVVMCDVPKSVGPVERCNIVAGEDPLGELMKILYDV